VHCLQRCWFGACRQLCPASQETSDCKPTAAGAHKR
jgi:hypothetical protein